MNAKKYELTIAATGIVAYSNNLKALEELAKSADMDYEGRLGWEIVRMDTDEMIAYQKGGLALTLADLCDLEYPSVRLYNCVLRHLVDVTGREVDDVLKNITMRDIRDMVIGGKFVNVRNVGVKTRKEFYDMLIEFCGNTRVTRSAININIDLHRHDWVKRHPEDLLTYEDPALEYWADLDSDYLKRYPF